MQRASKRSRRAAVATGIALVAGVLSSCTQGPAPAAGAGTTGAAITSLAAAGSASDLKAVCPATVVIQTNWWPQAEYGSLYGMLGGPITTDTDTKKVSAELVDGGVDTGVRLQINSGGPANAYTPAAKAIYLDDSITLAGVDIDQAAQFAGGGQPVQAVFAPMERSPVVLLWDPTALPAVHSIADLGRAGTPIIYFTGATYMDYLVGTGVLHQSQLDSSYDGTPARFVAEAGKVAQQGFLTNEVYQYEHELPQLNKPVGWQLVDDLGYPNYPEALAIRPDHKAALSGCLKKLVPVMQRTAAAYLADPARPNQLIASLVTQLNGYPYSVARADNAVTAMQQNRIMGNGPDGAIGSFDPARVQRVIDINAPIFAAHRTPLPAGLKAETLATNEFVDTTVPAR